jgi:hypothetical protein
MSECSRVLRARYLEHFAAAIPQLRTLDGIEAVRDLALAWLAPHEEYDTVVRALDVQAYRLNVRMAHESYARVTR